MSTTHRNQLYSLAAIARELDIALDTACQWRDKGYLRPHPDYADRARPRYAMPTKKQVARVRAAAQRSWKKTIANANQAKEQRRTQRRYYERLITFTRLREVLEISHEELRDHVECRRIVPVETSPSGKQQWFALPVDPDATREELRARRSEWEAMQRERGGGQVF